MNKKSWLYLSLAVLVTVAVYIPSVNNDWTDLDDQGYVYNNEMTKNLGIFTLPEYFSTYQLGNYHPLTMISLGIDYKLFGLNAKGYHAHAVLLHVLNTSVVFIFILMLTRKWKKPHLNFIDCLPPFVTALFFGINPTHAESVAWISERKDLLYTFYYITGLISYLTYLHNAKKNYYIFTLILFLLSCLSKGQAVTFPLALLLIDYFTNRTASTSILTKRIQSSTKQHAATRTWKQLWIEKIPFLIISLVFGIVAVQAQKTAGAFHIEVSWGNKILYASFSLICYLYKSIFPAPLAAVYPYPTQKDFVMIFAPIIVLGIFTVIFLLRKNRILVFGFLFFMINVLLILQFLSVGGAMMADRYTYLSYIGLFFIYGSLLHSVNSKSVRIGILILPTIFFSIQSVARIKVWKNSGTLYTDMLEYYPANPGANAGLADYYLKQGQNDSAYKYLNIAIKYGPEYADVLNNVAFNLAEQGRDLDKAEELIKRALEKEQNGYFFDTYGWVLFKKGKYQDAKQWFEKALQRGDVQDSSVIQHYELVKDNL